MRDNTKSQDIRLHCHSDRRVLRGLVSDDKLEQGDCVQQISSNILGEELDRRLAVFEAATRVMIVG